MFPVAFHGAPLSVSRDVRAGDQDWHIPTEVPVAFVYNRRNYAVMMATPDDLLDFALGFSLTEEVVKSPSDIHALDIHQTDKGVDLRFKIDANALERLDIVQRRRNMVGSASCGLCGLENADALFVTLPKVADMPVELATEMMEKALADLGRHQPLNQKTRSVHAAAWVNHTGEVLIAREDVGRHNAVDKLLGALAQTQTDMESGFLLVSSRCSYEIVEKAARRGVQAILSVSGPTDFALQKAKQAHMAIYSRQIKKGGDESAVRLA